MHQTLEPTSYNEPRTFLVREIHDASDLEAALRLRYLVFSMEGGDYRYADTSQGIYSDNWDEHGSIILVAVSPSGQVVGTIRSSHRRNGPYLGDPAYEFGNLAVLIGVPMKELLEETSIVSRGVVHKDWRKVGVFNALLRKYDQVCLREGILYSVGAVDIDNSRSLRIMKAHGYQAYGARTNAAGWCGEYIFRRICSPPP